MYEPKSEPTEFIAHSRAEAIAKAVEFFGVEESALTTNDLGENVSGATGRVVIVAAPTDRPAPRPDSRDRGDRDRGDRGDRDRDRGGDRGGRGGRDRDRGGRGGRDRDRGDRGGRGRDRDGDRDRGDRDRNGRVEPVAAVAALDDEPIEETVATVVGEIQEIGKFLVGALERMDLGPFEIQETEEDDFLVYQVSGSAAGRILAGESRAGDALQLIANQAAMRIDEDHKRVVVDIEGERERREEFLSRVAGRAAKRARDTTRSVALDPMNGKDRRAIHLALKEEAGIATMSIGEGRYRQVVVVPEGAAEYDEALEAMEAASS